MNAQHLASSLYGGIRAVFSHARVSSLACALAFAAASCAKEQESVSLSATTFNYSQDDLLSVVVNGKSAGSLVDPAKLGEVKGGGKVLCCISLKPAERSAAVTIRAVKGDQSVYSYTTEAEVRTPWPKIASYAVVHVLPGQKVVIEVVPTSIEPDTALLEQNTRKFGVNP